MIIMKGILCLLISILIFLPLYAWPGEHTPGRWGYLANNAGLSDSALETIIPKFTVIAITGFKIGKTGDIAVESPGLLKKIQIAARRHGITLYPVITFSSAAAGRSLLSSALMRDKTAASVSALARKEKFPGIHLDLEYLPPEDAGRLGDFLVSLRRVYKGTITMAVFPPVGFPEKWSGFHDLGIISSRVDGIVIMCYDYHGSHTGPGPVTDVRWAEENIKKALGRIEPERVWLGVPAYGYRWCRGRAAPLSARQGIILAKQGEGRRDRSGNLHIVINKAGQQCEAYIADRHARLLLQQLAERYDLRGTALWRIGFEE